MPKVSIDGQEAEFPALPSAEVIAEGVYLSTVDSTQVEIFEHPAGGFSDGFAFDNIEVKVVTERERIIAERFSGSAGSKTTKGSQRIIKAPMPGLVKKILVNIGETVTKQTPLMILEAMKMENVLLAGSDGTLKEIKIAEGKNAEKNAVLAVIE